MAEIAAPLPDEFHAWVRAVADRLFTAVEDLEKKIDEGYQRIVAGLPDGWSRKDFALVAARSELRGYLFARLDGKPIRDALWRQVRPSGDETPTSLGKEDGVSS